MQQPNRSYWEDELYDQTYDLIVIGAGLTGLSSAYFFKKRFPDANVLVLERGFYPIGASTRNAGFACIGSVGELIADLEIESEAVVKQRIQDRYEGLLLLRKTLGDKNIEYEACGGWEVFINSEEHRRAKEYIPKFNAWMEELIGERNVFESGTYLENPTIFNKVEGLLHPGKMVKALHKKCISEGIECRWNCTVKNLDLETNQVTLENDFSFKSNKLIIATNAFTSQLLKNHVIVPGRGYVFVTKKIDSLKWKGTFHYEKGYVYFRNLGDNRMLIGGGRHVASDEERTSEFGVNETIKNYLIGFSNTVLQLPQGWEIEQEWSGIMGFTESKSYLLEEVGKSSVLAAGLSGMGVALGMNLGKKAAGFL